MHESSTEYARAISPGHAPARAGACMLSGVGLVGREQWAVSVNMSTREHEPTHRHNPRSHYRLESTAPRLYETK